MSELFPVEGAARWRAPRFQAVADGLLDANLLRRNELLRPAAQQSLDWIERQIRAISAACRWLEQRIDDLDDHRFDIGHIAVGCALGYFSVRFPEDNWWRDCPKLADWHRRVEMRPSMVATRYGTLKTSLPSHSYKEGPPDVVLVMDAQTPSN